MATGRGQGYEGGCLCGAVRYEVSGPLRDVVECHCAMCRRTHGHFAAYTAAPKTAFRLVESRGLEWYVSSSVARRGFCTECGGSVLWERIAGDLMSIAAGTLDPPTGLRTVEQIFCEDAGDYYDLRTDVPRRPRRG